MNLCKYKDILGVPGKGIHKYRIFHLALTDIVLTIIRTLILSKLFNSNYLLTLLILFITGIFLHWLFCVPTKLNMLIYQFYNNYKINQYI